MTYYKKSEYKLNGFRISETENKKYDAILENKTDKKIIYVPFGDDRFEHHSDKTPLKKYSNLNHFDELRRQNFRKRMENFLKEGYFSPSYFSYHYLW